MNAEKAALVIVDGYTRFTTVYPLKPKEAPAVNAAMKRYIAWAERQFADCKVLTIVSDNGRELNNDDMKEWYQERGIEFLPNPPHSSHLNPCERVRQTLVHMLKTVMSMVGLPMSFWMYALKWLHSPKTDAITA
ncbi:unnamed protein product [Phytophthora fragariaefolia]|uniref:Unnamed protein product n=1 Tax=Phytophthora fragariaefolia TaxID=1490495 RepID=A0A9W7D1Y1_9STRA|nr:unnamed protein product [Phytophthora fragariaefolia]